MAKSSPPFGSSRFGSPQFGSRKYNAPPTSVSNFANRGGKSIVLKKGRQKKKV